VTGPWREVWRVSLEIKPGQSRLLNVAGEAVLVNAPSGLTVLSDEPTAETRLLSGLRVEVRPGEDAHTLVFDEVGLLYRWSPGSPPRKLWDTGTPPQKLEAIGLSHERILVQRPGASHPEWLTEMIDADKGIMWQRNGDLRGTLPWNESILAIPAERRSVVRLRLADGSPLWESALEDRAAALIAVAGEKLWLRTYEGELIGLDLRSGAVTTRLRVPLAAVPEGVVDQLAQLHLCTGSSYTILDLAADGDTVFAGALPAEDDAPSLVFGSAATPLKDGGLLFFDRTGRVYTLRAGNRPKLVWQSASPVIDCCVAHETIFSLNREGQLSALRP
jgi:hypothetical protein